MVNCGNPLMHCYVRVVTTGFWKAKGIIGGISIQPFREVPFSLK